MGPLKLTLILMKNLSLLMIRKLTGGKAGPKNFPKRFRRSLEELGPTYIKLGQMLSTRYDLFSKETLSELERLQDEVRPLPYSVIRRELVNTYGNPKKYFSNIEKKPTASASIAQVHRARMKDGTRVAIKIRRPNIEKTIRNDIQTLKRISRFIDRFVIFISEDITEIVDEFGASVMEEIDLYTEAISTMKFRNIFKDDSIVQAPEPVMELCTENVMVMEYVEGVKLSEIISGNYDKEQYPINTSNLVEKIGFTMLEQIFMHSMLHADPHPGNLMITKDGKLYFIDFGRVKYLDDELQTFLLEYMISIAKRDPDMMAEIISDNFGLKNKDTYTDDIRRLYSKYYGKSLERINFGELMVDSFMVSRKHQVRLPAQVFLLSRVIVLVEGIGYHLDPDFEYIGFLKSYFTKRRVTDVVKERIRQVKEDTIWNMVMVPRKLRNIDRLIMGNKKLQFKLPTLERKIDNFVNSINALAVAVIMAGLLVSVNKFEYPLIPQIILMVLGLLLIYEIFLKKKK